MRLVIDLIRGKDVNEAYAILKATINPSAEEFAQIFGEWNAGELNSFLIEITTNIFGKKDPETGKPLVDVILDKAGQKGTGKWTVGHAIEMAVPLSVISAAVEARVLSSMKEERVAASEVIPGPDAKPFSGDRAKLMPLREMERQYLMEVLEAVEGNKALAARILGVDRRTLYRKLERFDVGAS
jgi:6-phosphogluconate dehydrogenase